jgi:hypothetical protein
MNEQELREIVRETLARRGAAREPASRSGAPIEFVSSHTSHHRYDLPAAGDACLIEPAVTCNHCGYCQSHGH